MMDPIISATGINVPTAAETVQIIVDEIVAYAASQDPPIVISLDFQTALGQVISGCAYPTSQLMEAAIYFYNTFVVANAQGIWLDNLALLKGLRRLMASRSTVNVTVLATNNTFVAARTQAQIGDTEELVYAPFATTISKTSAVAFSMLFSGSGTWSLTFAGQSYLDTTSVSAAAAATAFSGWLTTNYGTEYTSSVDTATVYVYVTDRTTPFSVDSGTNTSLTQIYGLVAMLAQNTGPVVIAVGSITAFVASVPGVTNVYNHVAGLTGRARETDDELRIRVAQADIIGNDTATARAIRNAVLLVEDVTSVTVNENDTLATVDGIPAKAFECVVVGGDDTEIAEAIYEVKAAGIQAYGTTVEVITDVNGDPFSIGFSRPTPVTLTISVAATADTEATLPPDGITAIEDNILDLINTQRGAGKNVLYQQIVSCCLPPLAPAGIEEVVTVTIEVGGGPTYINDNVPIASDEYATVDRADITITVS